MQPAREEPASTLPPYEFLSSMASISLGILAEGAGGPEDSKCSRGGGLGLTSGDPAKGCTWLVKVLSVPGTAGLPKLFQPLCRSFSKPRCNRPQCSTQGQGTKAALTQEVGLLG